jgi:glycosyltransferase involved in cell wall biosynthesis
MLESHRSGINLFQRELISTLATVEWMSGHPRVFDVDDAVWLSARRSQTDAIAARSDLVICGNAFLGEHYRTVSRNVVIVPTAVDVACYPILKREKRPECVIGWSGTSAGFKYLLMIQDALRAVLHAIPKARVRVMSDRAPVLSLLPADRVDFVKWTPAREASTISGFDIGIMPLADGDWERGKCSYKMLQYMAARVPVVVSPVGMNIEVLAAGPVGLAATTEREWIDALLGLVADPTAAESMGLAGRAVVEQRYSKELIGRAVISALETIRPG